MLLNRNRAPSPPPDPERTVRLARGHRETHPTGQLRRRIACVFGGFDRSAAGGRGCSRRDRLLRQDAQSARWGARPALSRYSC